jgi:GNAT superfamily N-acetyltransferase
MKGSFSDTTNLSAQLFDLLDIVFPGIRQGAENIRALGVSWESVSTPFVCFGEGRLICHVGLIELPLILLGAVVKAGSVHAVATHPDFRHRGYYRLVMDEMIEYSAGRYETLVLTTEHPEYFRPFGFRVVREHLFRVRCDSPGRPGRLRLIDTRNPGDIALLHRLLDGREPVSNVVGVVNEQAIFCFNEGRRPLHYAADLDVIVCMEMEATRLTLFDIVGPEIPSLNALLEVIPHRVEEIAICFSPDRLEVEAEVVPYLFDHGGPSYLMVRGPFGPEGRPFTLPRSART